MRSMNRGQVMRHAGTSVDRWGIQMPPGRNASRSERVQENQMSSAAVTACAMSVP